MKVSYNLKNVLTFSSRRGRKMAVNVEGDITQWVWDVSRKGTLCAYSDNGLKVVATPQYTTNGADYLRGLRKGSDECEVTPGMVLTVLQSALKHSTLRKPKLQ